MDELHEFCTRILGDREAAARVAQGVRELGLRDRRQRLAAAVSACRSAAAQRSGARIDPGSGGGPGTGVESKAEEAPDGLAGAVAAELAAAAGRLPQRQREALALREVLGLSHPELAAAIGVEPAAVAPLLARARLRLRSELRGTRPPGDECPEHDRAQRTIALRQDSEPVLEADDEWLIEHLGHCTSCARAHAAMLEASVCYRAWRVPAGAVPAP